MNDNKIDLSNQAAALVRLSQAISENGTSPFPTGTPQEPKHGDGKPLVFEYQSGVNLMLVPRMGFNAMLSFPALRALSRVKEIRLNIELIKRQIGGMEWEIVAKKDEQGVEVDSVKKFFEKPNGADEWDTWLKMIIEDLLVLDAVTLYPERNENGAITGISVVDGATIRPLIDARGKTPNVPAPAYMQILYGMPNTWYSTDQLLYKPLNSKSTTPYGESPIEWILNSINVAIRREISRNAYFTDGNIPGALVYLGDISPEQVAVIDDYATAIMQGDIARANKLLFLPGGGSGTGVHPFQQVDQDDTNLDEWLMRVACWAFGNSPSEFGLVGGEGLGGSGFMDAQENIQYRSMILPISKYLTSVINRIIKDYLGRDDLQFRWVKAEGKPNPLEQSQVDETNIRIGKYTIGFAQDRDGVPEEYRGQAAAQPDTSISQYAPYFRQAMKTDLSNWKKRARRNVKNGERLEVFYTDVIPESIYAEISAGLRKAETVAQVDSIFDIEIDDTALIKSISAEVGEEKSPFRVYP